MERHQMNKSISVSGHADLLHIMWSYSLLARAELYLTVSESKYSCKWQRGSLNANTRVYVCTVDSYCD